MFSLECRVFTMTSSFSEKIDLSIGQAIQTEKLTGNLGRGYGKYKSHQRSRFLYGDWLICIYQRVQFDMNAKWRRQQHAAYVKKSLILGTTRCLIVDGEMRVGAG